MKIRKITKGSRKFWHDEFVNLSIENLQLSRALDMACVELTDGYPDGKVIEFLRKALNDRSYIEHKHYMLTGEILSPAMQEVRR